MFGCIEGVDVANSPINRLENIGSSQSLTLIMSSEPHWLLLDE